jgi:hypothetical protein
VSVLASTVAVVTGPDRPRSDLVVLIVYVDDDLTYRPANVQRLAWRTAAALGRRGPLSVFYRLEPYHPIT